MATTKNELLIDGNLILVWWVLAQGETGDAFTDAGRYADATVHVFGTPSGATLTMQGSNEPGSGTIKSMKSTFDEPFTLTEPDGTNLVFTLLSDVGKVILQSPLKVRPMVSGGDGSTDITVAIKFGQAPARWRQG